MHDWTKVEPGIYHILHGAWIYAVADVLNGGLFPPAFYALADQRTGGYETDVLTPRRRLSVRHVSTHRPVAVVELVSPANTKERDEYTGFVRKAADLIEAGVHFLFVDPYPPPARAAAGLHAAIWKAVTRRVPGRRPFAPPADRPLLAASYCPASDVTAAVQPFAVGEPVPDLPLYLSADGYHITLPLEATYAAAYSKVPQFWREVLER